MLVAALSISASVYHHEMGLGSTWGMATMILFVVTVTTFIVALRTLVELALGRLFQPG